MKIDAKLNLVIPIYGDPQIMNDPKTGKEAEIDTIKAYVHATPISREVFEANFVVISKTFSAIYGEGLGAIAGPRVARMMLKKVAEDLGMWDEVQGGLVAEMRRLANYIGPGQNGWETLPLEIAVQRQLIDGDDAAEVENAVAFFTVVSAMHRRNALRATLAGAASLWSAQITSLNCTDFAASLKTSTEAVNSSESPASSVPY